MLLDMSVGIGMHVVKMRENWVNQGKREEEEEEEERRDNH